MIRFCDKEVCCVYYGQLDRRSLLSYFFQGNLDEPVCVLNLDGTYRGWITYYALISCDKAEDAVSEDYVVLGAGIWEYARKFFAGYTYHMGEHPLLPVTDQDGNLVSFVYEDGEANREIRMLRELEELPEALSFADIYPQYACVKIYGCNELAVLFAEYLRKCGIAVITEGELWDGFFHGDRQECSDHQCFAVYAEGVEAEKGQNWVEDLLRSVSPEFECIDCIYEANIKKGFVRNVMGDTPAWIDYLKNSGKEIVIWGIGMEEQDIYDFLLAHGIRRICFVSDVFDETKRTLFGKKILSHPEIRKRHGKIVILDCGSKNSAWGTGAIDYYDYLGFHRNKDLFAVNDYLEIPHNNLKAVLKGRRILLVGDVILCEKTAGYLCRNTEVKEVFYADALGCNAGEYGKTAYMEQIEPESAAKDMTCFIVMPDMNVSYKETVFAEKKKNMVRRLEEEGILDYTDYFSQIQSFTAMEKDDVKECRDERLVPREIILGAIEGNSGNIFVKGLLDNHPSILMIADFSFFNNNLFWLCMKLKDLPSEKIPAVFREICQSENGIELKDSEAFEEKMGTLLRYKKVYTSQELFVILLISYVFMYGRDIKDVRNMVVYWEPHHMLRNNMEEFAEWLKLGSTCGILNVVRNICMVKGSVSKVIFRQHFGKEEYFLDMLLAPPAEKKKYPNCKRYVFRFEDLKLHPREELTRLCKAWKIQWSETLMETTKYGKKAEYDNGYKMVSDFDLQPVYNNYEEYLSEYDRFRISLLCAAYQKKYGYPYAELFDFSRRELQEMFLKKFRSESRLFYHSPKSRLDDRIRLQKKIQGYLWKARMTEFEEGEKSGGGKS